jgi:hypothetical protein
MPLTCEAVAAAAAKTTYYDAQRACEHGFVDAIRSPVIPTADVLYLTDQYLSTLPG